MKIIAPLLLALVLGGCGSLKHIAQEDALGTPESRVCKKELLERRDGKVEIVLIREDHAPALSTSLFFNDKPLAALWAGEKFSIWVEPNIYAISLNLAQKASISGCDFPSFSPKMAKEARWKVEVDARSGRRYEVRVDLQTVGTFLQASSVAIQ